MIYKFATCVPTDSLDSVWGCSSEEEESCGSYSDDAPTTDEFE